MALQNFGDWKDGEFTPGERRVGRVLKRVLDQVVATTAAVRQLRS